MKDQEISEAKRWWPKPWLEACFDHKRLEKCQIWVALPYIF
jgi:hypothetical protein